MPRRTIDSTPLYAFDAAARALHGVVCGVDEAGRGPRCRPGCCAALIRDPHDPQHRVAASKKLSE